MAMEIITIIDSFAQNEKTRDAVKNSITKCRSLGHDIMLTSGAVVPEDIQEMVDYLYHDKRNQLFQMDDYNYTQRWTFWINTGNNYRSHHHYYSRQRHGLAVLINLINSVKLAKSLGYTHFQKVLYDLEPSDKCLDWIKNIPSFCESKGKKGLFYYNNNQGYSPDIEGAYFFCEIDYFLSKIPDVQNEEDYRKQLVDNLGSLKFLIFERFIYYFLEKNSDDEIIKRDSSMYKIDFDVVYSPSMISSLNFESKYSGCPIRIFRFAGREDKEVIVLGMNFTEQRVERKVLAHLPGGITESIFKIYEGGWSLYGFPKDLIKIEVFDMDDNLIYTEINENIENWIEEGEFSNE
jgi:hypothetical protein